jgi:hypothetical protein
MKKIDLLIQETTTGWNNQFQSTGIDLKYLEDNKILIDERLDSAQIASGTVFFSFQSTNKYRIYSLNDARIFDDLGRDGYYSIKVICPINYKIKSPIELLNEINIIYQQQKKSGISGDSKNYDTILNNQNLIVHLPIICPKSKNNAFVQCEDEREIDFIFNETQLLAFNKVYFFSKSISLGTINSTKLENYQAVKNQLESFEVDNRDLVLKSLIINESKISINNFPESFVSLKPKAGIVKFISNDSEKERVGQFQNNILLIRRFLEKPKPPKPTKPTKPTKNQNLLIPIIFIAIIILSIGYWQFVGFGTNENVQNTIETTQNSKVDTIIQKQDTIIIFKKDTSFGASGIDVKAYSCEYKKNTELSSRRFGMYVTGQGKNTCFVAKVEKLKLNNKYVGNTATLRKSDIALFGLNEEETEQFITLLKSTCGCEMEEDKIPKPEPSPVPPKPKQKKKDADPVNGLGGAGGL